MNFTEAYTEEHKVLIDSMNQEEARAFIIFLKSAIKRSQEGIDNATDLLYDVCLKFKLGGMLCP